MSHPSFEITQYLRGELEGEARRAVSDHLIDCRECRREYLSLKKTREELELVPELEATAGFFSAVLASCHELALEETRADLALESPPRRLSAFLVTAVCLALAFVAWGVFLQDENPSLKTAISTPPLPLDGPPLEPSENAKFSTVEEPYLPVEEDDEVAMELLPLPPIVEPGEEADILSFDETDLETPLPLPPDARAWPLPERLALEIPPWSPPPESPAVSDDVGSYGRKDPSAVSQDSFWVLTYVSEDGSLPEPFVTASGAFAAVTVPRILELRMASLPTAQGGRALGATLGKLLEQEMRGGLGDTLHHHALITYHLALLRAPALRRQLERAVDFLVQRQNKDGGFGFQDGAPSNSLVSGWAALALMQSRDGGCPNTGNPLARIRRYFQRLTDPRTGVCGFAARGDQREEALSTVMAHMVAMDHRSPKALERRQERAWELATRDVRAQERHASKYVDLDSLLAFKILAQGSGRLDEWRKVSSPLLATMSQNLSQGRFEAWTPFARGLWVELLR